jgi:hypothetical protein
MTSRLHIRGRAIPFIVAAASIGLVVIGLLIWFRNTPRDYVRTVFSTIPVLPGSREIGREIRDWAEGPECPYASLSVVYQTDRSWDEVAAFYQQYMEQSSWGIVERRVIGRDVVANMDMEAIEGRRLAADTASRQSLTLTIVNFSQLSDSPPATSQTLFTIGVEYIPDVDFFQSSALCQD